MFNASFITPVEKINEELASMQEYLEQECSNDNMSLVQQRIQDLMVHMARAGKLKADAEYHYNNVLNSSVVIAIKEAAKLSMGATTLNKYIESKCKDFAYIHTWADRVNRSATHQIEALRSILSFAKAERTFS